MKPCKKKAARELFAGKAINVTIEGHKHLGAVLGSRSHLEEYVSEKVVDWVNEVTRLAEFAVSLPQACYAAFTFGLKHRWTYLLIPSITEPNCFTAQRELLELPVPMGGLGLTNPAQSAGSEFEA